jgi:hypothetical protein
MKKRIFHGKVNDVEFTDRDAMINYIKDLMTNGEQIHTYSSYYELTDTSDEGCSGVGIASDTMTAAMKQLDVSDLDVESVLDNYPEEAAEIIENHLTERMSNFMTILDASTSKQIHDNAKRFKDLLNSIAGTLRDTSKSLDDRYEDIVKECKFYEELLSSINKEKKDVVQYSEVYDSIIGWCEAMSDIIDEYYNQQNKQ